MRTYLVCGAAVLLLCIYLGSASARRPLAEPTTASASASASAMAEAGGNAEAKAQADAVIKAASMTVAKAEAEATAKVSSGSKLAAPEPKKGSGEPGKGADVAWLAFVSNCAGKRFDPKKISAGACGTLSGELCSRKDVTCSAGKTLFKDETGEVVATGDDVRLLFCHTAGSKKGTCWAP